MTGPGKPVKFSAFDEELKSRDDETGKFVSSGMGRKTIPIKVPKIYRGLIRSLLLESLSTAGLFIIWDFIQRDPQVSPEEKDREYYRTRLRNIVTDGDAIRLHTFFETDYWKDKVENRTYIDLKRKTEVIQ